MSLQVSTAYPSPTSSTQQAPLAQVHDFPQAITLQCPPTGASTPPNWFYSPGFGGAAAIVAACIAFFAARFSASATIKAAHFAAAAAEKRESDTRDVHQAAIRRDLRCYLVNAFRRAVDLLEDQSPSGVALAIESFQELLERRKGNDIALNLNDIQMVEFESAATALSVAVKSELSTYANRGDDKNPDKLDKDITLIAFCCVLACANALYRLEPMSNGSRSI